MTVVVLAESVALVVLSVLVVSLLRSHAEILRALHDLGVSLDPANPDSTTPVFDLRSSTSGTAGGITDPKPGPLGSAFDLMGTSPDGEAIAIGLAGNTGGEGPTLLAFLSSGCLTCRDFWDMLGRGETLEVGGRSAAVVAITRGPADESPAEVAALTSSSLTTLMSSEAFEDYGVPVSPYFVLLDGGRVIGEGAAASWVQLRNLLGKAVADGAMGRTRRELLSGRLRSARVDAELRAAGIGPDHESLRPDVVDN